MQFERFYRLNHSIVASFEHLHLPQFQLSINSPRCRTTLVIVWYGFLGQVVDLALYETNVLGSKPPPVRLSTNPQLTCVLFSLPCLSICATHKPTLNLCTRFGTHGVGPSPSSIQDRYSIPTPPLHRCKVRWTAITDRPNAKHNLAQIVRTALSSRRCDEDLMGEVPRLWNCLQAAAMESQPRYTD
jgi:hypothetical protein